MPLENLRHIVDGPSGGVIIKQTGPLFGPILETTNNRIDGIDNDDGNGIGTQQHLQNIRDHDPSRVLIIAAAPRSVKYIVSLWSSLECFTADADHVAISAPTWSQPIVERFLDKAKEQIPRFASGQTTLEAMVSINDRYDVGLWCDALAQIGIHPPSEQWLPSQLLSYDEVALLNDSVYALREYSEIFRTLGDKHVSMTSLNYSFIHPKGTGDEHFWLESVWRGFDRAGIQTFAEHSCRPADDPYFCPHAWWGKKGCIVENFERAMAKQFPRDKVAGLFPSDVPRDMLTRKDSFPSWVRHPPYWNKLVEEEGFPVSKVNWKGMIDSIDDARLQTCTQHLDREWLESFDFSIAKTTI